MSRRPSRPPEVVALAVLLAAGAVSLLAGVLFPLSDQAPITLGWVLVGLAVVMLALTYWAGTRLPRWALLVQTVLAAVLNSLLVACAHTTGGAIADALAYIWLTVYVAIFFPRAAAAYVALCAAGFGVGLLLGGLPHMFAAWVVLSVSVVALGLLLSRVSRTVQGRLVTDLLTGALNRGGLSEAAVRARRRGRRRTGELTVAALDLDGFKAVNDAGGHASGDRLLAEATAAWRAALRRDDVLARTGGDEFVLLLPNTSPDEAVVILDRVRAAHPVAWSAGVTEWRPGDTLETCLERADRSLYAAKRGNAGAG